MFEISLEKLTKDIATVSFENDRKYLTTYPEFLQYFKSVDVLTKHHLVIGIHFTYGWMPTIFKFHGEDNLDNAVVLLNKAKSGALLSAVELELLKSCLNNSLVGVSKLLHFIRPDVYAIWDSRVYRYLTGKEAYQHSIHNYNSYLNYLRQCHEIINQSGFEPIHASMIEKVGYPMTPLRSIELIMFKKGVASKPDNNG